jgi:hypothetical protein
MAEHVDPNVSLHTLRITSKAPVVLTPNAVAASVTDFGVLYRMSTGIYGKYGLRRFNQPFPYARPYIGELSFGSPFVFEVIVPTAIVLGSVAAGIKSLPNVLALVKQIMLFEGEVQKQQAENKLATLKAEKASLDFQEEPENLEKASLLAEMRRDADMAEAYERGLRSRAEMAAVVHGLDSETYQAVLDFYGKSGIEALIDIARRAEGGPTRPTDLSIEPTPDPEAYPRPPELPRANER